MKTLIAFGLFLGLVTLTPGLTWAAATSAPCTPKRVITSAIVPTTANNHANRYLSLNCNEGPFYIVYTNTSNTTNEDSNNATGCFVDVDLVKMWQSLSVSAQLSGRTLTVYFNNVVGTATNCPSLGTQPILAIIYQ